MISAPELPAGIELPLGELVQRATRAFQNADFPAAEKDQRAVIAVMLFDLATTMAAQFRMDDAATALDLAVEHCPHFWSARVRLGEVYYASGRFDDAEAQWKTVLENQPDNPEAHDYLGHLYMGQGMLDEALELFNEALRLRPRWFKAASHIAWLYSYRPDKSPAQVATAHVEACRFLPRPDKHVLRALRSGTGVDRDPERCLRIGYLSPNAPCFIQPVLDNHDKDKFFTVLYLENVTGEVGQKQFVDAADSHRWIHARSDAAVADMIRKDGIDILVDCAGHTAGCRLGVCAMKPAPIQVTWCGYPQTTGLPEMDYRITDNVCDPIGQKWHGTEHLVRLPGSFVAYRPPPEAPEVQPLPCLKNGYLTFGSTHDLMKVNQAVLRWWLDILRCFDNARMLFFRHSLQGEVINRFGQRLRTAGFPMERVQIGCPATRDLRYLDVYHHFDILLDTFPWSGQVTVCDAAWMGVPTVTYPDNQSSSRLGESVNRAIGMGMPAFGSQAQYVDYLAGFRATCRDSMRRARICDGAFMTGELERAYRSMWRVYCDRKEPICT